MPGCELHLQGAAEMSLKQQIERALERAAFHGAAPTTLSVTEDGVRFEADVVHVERLACAFSRMEVVNAAWATAPLAKVKQVADQLSSRLTYLLEPIRTIEVDAESCTVQLRSNPPQVGDDATSYYELEARGGGSLRLQRFEKTAGEPRRPVQIEVTREVFRRLVDDFAAAN